MIDATNKKDYGSNWWRKFRGSIIKWWSVVYLPFAGHKANSTDLMQQTSKYEMEEGNVSQQMVLQNASYQVAYMPSYLSAASMLDSNGDSYEGIYKVSMEGGFIYADAQGAPVDDGRANIILAQWQMEQEIKEKAKLAALDTLRKKVEDEQMLRIDDGQKKAQEILERFRKEKEDKLMQSIMTGMQNQDTEAEPEMPVDSEEEVVRKANEILARLQAEAASDQARRLVEIEEAKRQLREEEVRNA